MRSEVTFTAESDSISSRHLLQHYNRNTLQEDLCFALWRPSNGNNRRNALIGEIILPNEGERLLHGNASFQPSYVGRVMHRARQENAGVAFMHSHPNPGWQRMSPADVEAERDVLAYPAGVTGLPLVGLTIGSDGYWSARFWERSVGQMQRTWCHKVRIVGPRSYRMNFNDNIGPPEERRNILKRTFDAWGNESQNTVSRLNIGIVGLGSVGSIVAEAIARIGVAKVTLIDPDRIEEHNLDRLLHGTVNDIGQLKVDVVARAMKRHSTAKSIQIEQLPVSVHDNYAYKSALDCDVIFSCVDRPIARDVLNYISNAHLIPVIDGGVSIEADGRRDKLFSAHWRAHIVTPYHRCMRCNGQYNSSMVVMELDGSLDDQSYVVNLPPEQRAGNQNVFPFSQSVAGLEVNLMLRYLLSEDWWPDVRQQEHQFVTGETRVVNEDCQAHCTFRQRRAVGDAAIPFYLTSSGPRSRHSVWRQLWNRFIRAIDKGLSRTS